MRLRRSSGKRRKPKFIVRRIEGESMLPTLSPGQIIICRTSFADLKIGDIVVIDHSGLEKIKRVELLRGKQVFVTGDNADHSTDSRSFGWLDTSAVRAKIVWPWRLR